MSKNVAKTIQGLESREILSPKISEIYVPVYTSDLARILAPEFEFEYARFFRAGSTAHAAVFHVVETGQKLVVYNSYDRSVALRVLLKDSHGTGFGTPLNIDRIIHKGNRPKNFVDGLEDVKQDIINSIGVARTIREELSNLKIRHFPDLAKEIQDIIFEDKSENLVGNPVSEELYNRISVYGYIQVLYRVLNEGNYKYINKKGKIRKGRKHYNPFKELVSNRKILEVLEVKFPEIFV